MRIGKRTFFSPRPEQLTRALSKVTSNRFLASSNEIPPIETWAQREAFWVQQKLKDLRPAAAILVHEAIHFAPFLAGVSPTFALLGHIPAVQGLQAGAVAGRQCEDRQGLRTSSSFKDELSAALAHVNCVGLNNREDMVYVTDELGAKSVAFVGMGYPDIKSHPDSDEPVVLFVGNATESNSAALSWFINNVWPAVVASHPTARFRVVGRAAASVKSSAEMHVETPGVVDDLGPEYGRAQIVVAPLIQGTAGVKIKVAEAMAHGRPLVSTSLGIDSKDPHQSDKGVIVADDARNFADAIVALLGDPELRKAKSIGARQTFVEQFSYEACYGDIRRWLEQFG
jgi:hypothetical protein